MLAALLLAVTAASAAPNGDPTPDTCTATPAAHASFKARTAPQGGVPGGWPRKDMKRRASPQAERAREQKRAFKRYPADVQQALLRGELREGLDEVAATIAWGLPDHTWDRPGKRCRALVYADQGSGAAIVATCDGHIDQLFDVQAPVDCTRLDAVTPRLKKHRRWFAGLPLEQQASVVFGVPAEWMTADDLTRTLGDPVKRLSTDTRLVFHDDTGYYEGLTVELVDGRAARWTAPDERLFTRTGRRQFRRDQRKAERDAWRKQQQAAAREARRQAVTTLLVAAAVIAANDIAAQQSGGPGDASPAPAPSRSSGGPTVQRTETAAPAAVGDPSGTHTLQGWCSAVFQFSSTVTVRGGSFTAKTVLTPGPNVTAEVRRSTQSGAVVQDGESISFGRFASGLIDITGGLSLTLGAEAPVECVGQRVIHAR